MLTSRPYHWLPWRRAGEGQRPGAEDQGWDVGVPVGWGARSLWASQSEAGGRLSYREEAEAALADALAAQGGGDPETVAGFLERVWLPAKRDEVERSTFDQYAWAVRRHIVPELGAVKLSGLTPALLSRWQAKLLAGDR